MKILIIVVSYEMNINYISNLKILDDYLKKIDNIIIDYCGISSNDDFINYESILSFKYKVINSKKQLSKICDFITQNKNELDYDWYIKFRPEIKLYEPINFDILSNISINARARTYIGPKKIKYGMSVNGEGKWKNIGDCFFNDNEESVILDDQFYIFHKNVINLGGFETFDLENVHDLYIINGKPWYSEHEWFHSNYWKSKNISLNVIGINVCLQNHDCTSGNLNI